eukprot:2005255-Lingulodinium_polyedra.AAC.1
MRRASELPAQQEVLPTQICQVPSRQGAPVPGLCRGGNLPLNAFGAFARRYGRGARRTKSEKYPMRRRS